ncbi:MAG: hypothetical protein KF902_02545 [Phycisphaeraceae bacterium]|nr:hypothetical protein [Phycisphaeraceae bacterium]MCW5769927.1 hypothetical protein [Phycisphaeraceae bacterium]
MAPLWVAEAWLNVHGRTSENARTARQRFLEPLGRQLDYGGIDGVSEILDAEPPKVPRDCLFQAWSVGKMLRATELLDHLGAAQLACPDRFPAFSTAR